jgi:hypothetical protein
LWGIERLAWLGVEIVDAGVHAWYGRRMYQSRGRELGILLVFVLCCCFIPVDGRRVIYHGWHWAIRGNPRGYGLDMGWTCI